MPRPAGLIQMNMIKNVLRLTLIPLPVLGMMIVCCIWFWRPGILFYTPNLGHRLGGDSIESYPENTLEVFRIALAELEESDDYAYSECDLRETCDHQIALFHDWDIARLVPDTIENRAAVEADRIDKSIFFKNLTLGQVKRLRLKNDCQIPSLEEFFECAAELEPNKPILLELKLFHHEETCSRVIQMAKDFRDDTGLEVHFLAFIRNIKRSHPRPREWLDEFRAAGFRVYQVYRPKTPEYDLCETW